eukprot:6193291-Pleurochrysis_carterae.AAC.2
MRRRLFGSQTKSVKHHIKYHSTQKSAACEESTLKVREGYVSHGAQGVFGTGANTRGGEGAHRCRMKCMSHASSLVWE